MTASACAKHFFGYSLENCFHARDNCRFSFNAEMTQQEIEDTYLPAFQSSVEEGGVSGLMCREPLAVYSCPSLHLTWVMPPYLLYGVKYIGPVSLCVSGLMCREPLGCTATPLPAVS